MGINAMWIGANDKHREGTMVWVSDKITSVKGLVTGIRENPIIQENRIHLALAFIGTDCICSCKSNFHAITTTTALTIPGYIYAIRPVYY